VVVLMDSTHPQRVYDDETRKAGARRGAPVVLLRRDVFS
jgi:hypothetical protein